MAKFVDSNWTKAVKISNQLKADVYSSVVSISYDGKKLFLIRKDILTGNEDEGNIYMSEWNGTRWSSMKRLNKNMWGAKSQGKFEKYVKIWPNAKFIYMMRDGRDILASQLNTGSFNPKIEQVAKAWSDRIVRFNRLLEQKKIKGCIVKYEELACNTEEYLNKVCSNLNIPFHENMLNHSKHDISLLHEPRGQLSAAQVAKPIDTTSIGRWKNDLDEEQIKIFQDIAGNELKEYNYEIV